MKWREYNIGAGCGWYEVMVLCKRFSRDWWHALWWYGIFGNFYFYANKWFGKKIRLTPKQRRIFELYKGLE